MNSHISSLQLLGELTRYGAQVQLPPYFRELIQKIDIPDYGKLQEFFFQEIQSGSLQVEQSAAYISFSARQLLLFQLLRSDKKLTDTIEMIRHRFQSVHGQLASNVRLSSWEAFLSILEAVHQRITRNSTLEAFEDQVSNIPWGELQQESGWASLVSGILGLAYSQEDFQDQRAKAKIWLDQSFKTADGATVIAFRYALAQYHLQEGNLDAFQAILDQMKSGKGSGESSTAAHLDYLASLDLYSHLLRHQITTLDPASDKELQRFREEVKSFDASCREVDSMPTHSVADMEANLAVLYGNICAHLAESDERTQLLDQIDQYFDRALEFASTMQDPSIGYELRLTRAEILHKAGAAVTEKEMKEIVAWFKKGVSRGDYIRATSLHLSLLEKGAHWQKLSDALIEVIRFGQRQQDASRYYLILSALQLGNTYYHRELDKPGVSWIVDAMADYFQNIAALIEELATPGQLAAIGTSMFEWFRRLYDAFEPVSHFNIYVYYRYQYQAIPLLHLSLMANNDVLGQKIAGNLINEMADLNNPLNLMRADWDDFKDVPNEVRNKTLNKCINISKGDLPKAADLLEFSYRNLRSYITFKEVNRLGFFLDLQTTQNRQLEQGIRFMFHDLYKQGTIFEVVFDMPAFLVEHATSGFYSQDLEEALNIKGTTAKKYIKIMAGIGMIKQEKVSGRKHFYRLQKEQIMKRLGAEQTTLID